MSATIIKFPARKKPVIERFSFDLSKVISCQREPSCEPISKPTD